MAEIRGRIVTGAEVVRGRLRFEARILALEAEEDAPDWPLLVPGFVDLHVHGGGGADVMAGEAAVRHMAAFHLRHGTTALLATTVCAPPQALLAALDAIRRVAAAPAEAEAGVLGVHLEGPFLDPRALGAQPPFTCQDDPALARRLLAAAPVRVVTLAPEADPRGALLALFRQHGVRVQIGHTRCTYAAARAMLERGAHGFTHLYNAMSGLHHREPGAVGCALAHARHAEIIPDLQHVHAAALEAARRAIPGLYGVTDAVAAAGMPDGDYRLGDHRVRRRGPRVELADGTLAGSVLTMDQAFRNLLALGLDELEAARRLATIPADYLGLKDRGRLVSGARADFVVFERGHELARVYVAGRPLAPAQ